MTYRIDEPRPLFGDRWPDPPEDAPVRVRRGVADPIEAPHTPYEAPRGHVSDSPARWRETMLKRASDAATLGAYLIAEAIECLAVTDAATNAYDIAATKAVALGNYIAVVRGE